MESFQIGRNIVITNSSSRDKYGRIIDIEASNIIIIKFSNSEITKFKLDTTSNIIYEYNNSNTYKYEILEFGDELLQKLTNLNTVEKAVRLIIGRPEVECLCVECLESEINELELLAENLPHDIYGNMASIYIITHMIPRLKEELRISHHCERFSQIVRIFNRLSHNLQQQSLDVTVNLNNSISLENLDIIMSTEKNFNPGFNSYEDKCIFCLDKFCDMDSTIKFIECPNCLSKFCSGSDEDLNECKGLKYHLNKDNRCPVCRFSEFEWTKKVNEIHKKKENARLLEQNVNKYYFSLSIEDLLDKPVIKKVIKKKMNYKKSDKFYQKKFKKSSIYDKRISKR